MSDRNPSNTDVSSFWGRVAADRIVWRKSWKTVFSGEFASGDAKWFEGGELNVSENCLDRHIERNADKNAIIWIGNEIGEKRVLTYKQLYQEVLRCSQGLIKMGVRKGDRIVLYMPMVPEAAIAMLASSRIGAVHSVVFGGFSAKSLRERVDDCQAKWLITADEAPRGTHKVQLKKIVDEALSMPQDPTQHQLAIEKVVVLQRTKSSVSMQKDRDITWEEMLSRGDGNSDPIISVSSEDPLFILYTSGSTGRPKGVLHTTAGYLTYVTHTFSEVFDYRSSDVYWCTADVGWITGHSYIVYGPLSNGATVLMFEGVPTYPDPSRFWRIIEENKVTIFYTAPTALRALMKLGDHWVSEHDLSSLRILGSVGEPINPKAWNWYHEVVGKNAIPIVDTWWQTETGGVMISPSPKNIKSKPGVASQPMQGIFPALVEPQSGTELHGVASGALVIKHPWPGLARTVYGDHERFRQTYFSSYKGFYFTGDGASRDEDGDYSISGRMDDVINVSGHRLGTFEIESALVSHPAVAESAVIGVPHEIKGQGIYAFVTLKDKFTYTKDLKTELIQHVRKEIGPIATPEFIHWAPGLPKTRSGKIMRRILRKIATNELDSLGDTSTLADPAVVQQLIKER